MITHDDYRLAHGLTVNQLRYLLRIARKQAIGEQLTIYRDYRYWLTDRAVELLNNHIEKRRK